MIAIMQTSTKLSNTVTPIALDDAGWDAFVQGSSLGHPLQTSAWGRLKARFGWQRQIVALAGPDGCPQAGSLLLFRRVAGLSMAYAPKGPLTSWSDPAQTSALLAALRTECSRQGALFLKIEPDLPDTPANRNLLTHYGFRPSPQSIQPRSTIVLEIGGSEEAILQRMKSKWRYNIRLAERKGVTVREITRTDLTYFNELMQNTGERDGFAVRSANYYSAAYELFVPQHGVFLLAEYAGQPLAALVVCITGQTACYLWGASGDHERNRMPNHALQWAAIRWARSRGAARYDFYGIPDEIGQVAQGLHGADGSGVSVDELPLELDALPSHGLWGVYRFKQGFGGTVVRSLGAWDLPINPLGYWLYGAGLTLKKRIDGRQAAKPPGPTTVASSPTIMICKPIEKAEDWRRLLAGLADPHVLQSWEWGAIKAQTEWGAARFGLLVNQQPQAAFQFLWRQPIAYLPWRIGYVPKGPVVDWGNGDLVDATLAEIERQARWRQCIFVKIDPDVREDTTTGRLLLHALARRGWRRSHEQIQFKNTGYSDLTVDEEQLLSAMKSKWRYNIRLAERRGIRVRQGSATDFASFYQLYAETGRRDGFLTRPLDYYVTTWRTFLTAQEQTDNPAGGTLLLAEHPDDPQPVAGLFLLRFGSTAWYFYGASSERQRRDMPNYLLQWEALRWAKAQGCTRYDWWGAPTQPGVEQDSLQGVWQFKQGFGAELQPHIGAWDYPVTPLLYRLYREIMPQLSSLLRQWTGHG
jgi:lipid II:glycine glycyltransferase (peptidoglycan interpeptide bridge formation enzyme)